MRTLTMDAVNMAAFHDYPTDNKCHMCNGTGAVKCTLLPSDTRLSHGTPVWTWCAECNGSGIKGAQPLSASGEKP